MLGGSDSASGEVLADSAASLNSKEHGIKRKTDVLVQVSLPFLKPQSH
jgi:hypothetical protein